MSFVSGGFGGVGGSSSFGFEVGTNPHVVSVAISHLCGEFYHTLESPSGKVERIGTAGAFGTGFYEH